MNSVYSGYFILVQMLFALDYTDLFDIMPIGLFIFGQKNLIKNVNHFATTMLGTKQELLEGKPFTAFKSKKDAYITKRGRSHGLPLQIYIIWYKNCVNFSFGNSKISALWYNNCIRGWICRV
jgi:hypothetical protein